MGVSGPSIRLVLIGPFRIEIATGGEIFIRASKSRGLLALLALAPNGHRSRTWLQDKLWSDRGREQAAASLRQALSQLRDDLGDHGDLLTTTREFVGLDLSRIDLVREAADQTRQEFLEGIDVRDPEFESWLRTERMARSMPSGHISQVPMYTPGLSRSREAKSAYIVVRGTPRSPEWLFEDIFSDCLECSLRETLTVDIYRREPPSSEMEPMVLTVQCFSVGPQSYGLRVHIEQGKHRRAIWTGMRIVPSNGAPPVEHQQILALAFEATEALADGLLLERLRSRIPLDASLMARMAIRKIFLMSPEEIIQADALLASAFEIDTHPQFLAWRIQLRVIQRMERHKEFDEGTKSELSQLISQALALDPHNSMVLAATANARLLVDCDPLAGVEMARASLRMNSANPFAWDCLSIALLMSGSLEEAHRHQLRANEIAARYPIRHFWDMGACLTSVVTGRHEDAARLARSASSLVPTFRPPLRYLAALNAVRGDHDSAVRYATRLRDLEPDFSFDRLISDETYPVAALRRSGLLSEHALRELEHHRL